MKVKERQTKRSGAIVRTDNGKLGIAYWGDQGILEQRKSNIVYQPVDDKFKPVGKKRSVNRERLNVEGYVD